MATMTITHLCGHRVRHNLKGAGAVRKSAEAFDLSMCECPDCVAQQKIRPISGSDESESQETAMTEASIATTATGGATARRTIHRDATLLIQQPCASCNGTGADDEQHVCWACMGLATHTRRITLAELAEALGVALATPVIPSAASGY